MIRQVSPWDIELNKVPYDRDVRKQRNRLEREGQIEPIKLKSNGKPDLDSWAYADEQIVAARELGWETILVC